MTALTKPGGLPEPSHQINRRETLVRTTLRSAALILVLISFAAGASAQQSTADLGSKSIEDLMNIEVTSVSKKEERLFQTAAAVSVITQDQIRHSGLTSIPELLRLVPGLDVARIDGNKWAISSRGFNGRVANKLLVLIDGRSVYSPETSGVYWEVQDLAIEDIERIEVVRGPGGTLWGANAVNGVINIITKHSEETLGALFTAGAGTQEQGFGTVRYGSKIGEGSYYRVYGKYFKRHGMIDVSGANANDGQQAVRGGGRLDWQMSDRDALTLEGDLYHTNLRETALGISAAAPFAPPVNTKGDFSGVSLLGRWKRNFSDRSDMTLQVYYDRFDRHISALSDHISTVDLDFQHNLAVGARQSFVWGLGYRLISHAAKTNGSSPIQFNPAQKTFPLFSGFAQDEITLVKDRLRLMIGAKLEHNSFSGFEAQPSVRLSWTPTPRQTVWASVSRAVRTPARTEQDIRVNYQAIPGPIASVVAVVGSPSAKSEALVAYELGYRAQPFHKLSLDVATFSNTYHHLTSFEPGLPFLETNPLPVHLLVPVRYANLFYGETYGAEASVNYDATRRWKIQGSYSFLRVQLHPGAGSADVRSESAEGDNPRHQFQVHSYFKLSPRLDLDLSLYHVSRLLSQPVPRYTRVDTRVGWRVREGIELSVGLQNLLDERHVEFAGADAAVLISQPQRSAYGKLSWHF